MTVTATYTVGIGIEFAGRVHGIGSLRHIPQSYVGVLVQRLGISVLVMENLISYRQVVEKLGIEHPVCQFHLQRWVGRALHELAKTVPKEWLWTLDETMSLMTELPPEGSRHLFELWKQIPQHRAVRQGALSALDQLHLLLIRLPVPSLTREANNGNAIGSSNGIGMFPGPIMLPRKSSVG